MEMKLTEQMFQWLKRQEWKREGKEVLRFQGTVKEFKEWLTKIASNNCLLVEVTNTIN